MAKEDTTVSQLFAQAEKANRTGEYSEAAQLLWQTVQAAVSDHADRYSSRFGDDLVDWATALEYEDPNQRKPFTTALCLGMLLRAHAQHDSLTDKEFDLVVSGVRDFIRLHYPDSGRGMSETVGIDYVELVGRRIYLDKIQPGMRSIDHAKLVVIDVLTGDYEVAPDEDDPRSKLRERRPDGQFWYERVGYNCAFVGLRGAIVPSHLIYRHPLDRQNDNRKG